MWNQFGSLHMYDMSLICLGLLCVMLRYAPALVKERYFCSLKYYLNFYSHSLSFSACFWMWPFQFQSSFMVLFGATLIFDVPRKLINRTVAIMRCHNIWTIVNFKWVYLFVQKRYTQLFSPQISKTLVVISIIW